MWREHIPLTAAVTDTAAMKVPGITKMSFLGRERSE
jgi:hypothetical protein